MKATSVVTALLCLLLTRFAYTDNTAEVQPPVSESNVIILADLSTTAPIKREPAFTAKLGQRLSNEIGSIQGGANVMLRPVGLMFSDANAEFERDYRVSYRLRAPTVGLAARSYLKRLSDKAQGQGHSALSSSLVGFAEHYQCHPNDHYILMSDGLDYVPGAVDAYRLIVGTGSLPPPPEALFSGGCRLSIWGIGRGWLARSKRPLNGREITRLTQLWQQWWQAGGGHADRLSLVTRF